MARCKAFDAASVAALVAFAGGSTGALAQDGVRLEEVVVTAQKREESLQDAPISIVAYGEEKLTVKGIYNLDDLQSQVPNLQFTPHPNSSNTARIFMRGIGLGDDQLTQDPSVAVYLDGVYLARSQGLSIDVADMQRIEVLRGPQGALYGRNATGGAINFITEKPDPEAFGFEQRINIGKRDLLRAKTSVNIPVGDTAALKLAYLQAEQDGFVENVGQGSDYFGSDDRQAFMADFLWRPSSDLELRYTYDRSDIQDSPSFIAQSPRGFEFGDRPDEGSPFVTGLEDNDIVTEGHSLTVTWDLQGDMQFKSITAVRDLQADTFQDYHTGVFAPLPIFSTDYNADQDQVSQEFQLQGYALDERLEYILGFYYFDEDGQSFDLVNQPLGGIQTVRLSTIENTAYAVFGQTTWTPGVLESRLHLTLGARWSKDKRVSTLSQTNHPLGGSFDPGPILGDGDNDFDSITPTFVLKYDIGADANVYGKVAKGYKTGGYSIRASSFARFNAGFDEEKVTSYELGLKSRWLQDRLQVNVATFLMDYDDIQVSVVTDPNNTSVVDVLNAGEATIEGAELDITALLGAGFTVDLSYGYVDPDFDEVISFSGVDETNRYRFVHTPNHSLTLDLSHEVPVGELGTLATNINYTWQAEKLSDTPLKNSPLPRNGIDEYGLLNARIGLRGISLSAGTLDIAVWGRNLGDEEYYLSHFTAGVPSAIYGDPRTYGVEAIYRY